MLRHATPEIDARADKQPLAVLPAVRLDIINSDPHNPSLAGLSSHGRTGEHEKKERAKACARCTKPIHNVAKINAGGELHMI
jgi:hypothetical protein